jgi:serine/threonine protein kinase/Tol biopolymer transport system component
MTDSLERIGQQVGEYRLQRWLGGGGFGDVYLAEHVRDHSPVAVKLLQIRLTRREDLQTFINEARTMRLKHPHIMPLLDFGIDPEDLPFLVMEYAAGGTVRDRYPKGTQMPLNTVLSYVKQAASALQYAHDQRLIHRDVKPENMLLRADGTLLLSDFGIATVAHSSHSLSLHQGIGGTLPYMAPEQIQGQARTASDQYSLGIVVYEWLTGRRPFEGTAIEVATQQMMRQPASLVAQVPTLSRAIERIVLKALEKDPQGRYASVWDFALALEQAGQETQRFIVSQTPGVAPQITHAQEALITPKQALSPSDMAEPSPAPFISPSVLATPPNPSAFTSFETTPIAPGHQFGVSHTPPDQALTTQTPSPLVRQPSEVSKSHRRVSRRYVILGLGSLSGLAVAGGLIRLLMPGSTPPPLQRHPTPTPTPPTPLPASYQTVFTFEGHAGGSVDALAWSPDGSRIASAGPDTLLIWNALTGQNVVTLQGQISNTVNSIAWSPDGKYVAAGGWYPNGDVQIWDATTGKVTLKPQARSDTIYSITWSPDGKYIAAGGYLKVVDVWDATTGERLYTDSGYAQGVTGISWSRDGKRIAAVSYDSTLQLWDALTGAHRTTYHLPNGANALTGCMAWSPDGTEVAFATKLYNNNKVFTNGIIQILDPASGRILHTQTFPTVGILSWSPDGKSIASGSGYSSDNKTLYIWNANTGTVLHTQTGLSTYGPSDFPLAWSPVGKYIAFADYDKVDLLEVAPG